MAEVVSQDESVLTETRFLHLSSPMIGSITHIIQTEPVENYINKAERGFGHPSQYSHSPLPINFREQTDTHHAAP